MANDLIERLRQPWFTHGCEQYQREAADEIERLRTALNQAAGEFDLILQRLRDEQPERAMGAAICGAKDARAAIAKAGGEGIYQ